MIIKFFNIEIDFSFDSEEPYSKFTLIINHRNKQYFIF